MTKLKIVEINIPRIFHLVNFLSRIKINFDLFKNFIYLFIYYFVSAFMCMLYLLCVGGGQRTICRH